MYFFAFFCFIYYMYSICIYTTCILNKMCIVCIYIIT